MHEQAMVIAKEYLQRKEFELYLEYFNGISKETSKNRIFAEAHKTLLGEDILETKRRLRTLKK